MINQVALISTKTDTAFFKGQPIREKLFNFIERETIPNVIEFDHTLIETLFSKNMPIVILFSSETKVDVPSHWEMFNSVAKKNRGKQLFVWCYTEDEFEGQACKRFAEFMYAKNRNET